MSVASAGNDHRLGANEAPPAIVSIFLGDELGAIVDALISDKEYTSAERVAMDLGVAVLPNFLKDNTDRNRTSPFAFTGNKFEFRMPGSAVNLSDANTILNTATATPTSGQWKPSAAAWRTIPRLPTRCRASSIRRASICSVSSTCSPRSRFALATR